MKVVLPAPVPPEIRMLMRALTAAARICIISAEMLLSLTSASAATGPAAEAPDRHAGAVERQRRNDRVDARAVRKPGIDHGRGFIHPPADAGHDAVDHLHQVLVVAKLAPVFSRIPRRSM